MNQKLKMKNGTNVYNSKLLEFKPIKIEQVNIGSLSNVILDNFENKIGISKYIDDLKKILIFVIKMNGPNICS